MQVRPKQPYDLLSPPIQKDNAMINVEQAKKCANKAYDELIKSNQTVNNCLIEQNEEFINEWLDKCLTVVAKKCKQGKYLAQVKQPFRWKFLFHTPYIHMREVMDRLEVMGYYTANHGNGLIYLSWLDHTKNDGRY